MANRSTTSSGPARPRARKRLGQHFLEPAWADRLVAVIQPDAGDRFVEIGAGPGALTLRLAPRVRSLVAIEVDPRMIEALRPKVPPNVSLVCQDVLDFDLNPIVERGPVRIAGNLPYNLSSPILFKLVRQHRSGGGLRDATLMLQREVAARVTALPGTGEYGVLAILLQLHADIDRLLALPPGAFRPPPRVHSAVVRLRFRAPAVSLRDEAGFEGMVRSMFTRRRKMLTNALAPYASSRRRLAEDVLSQSGIDPRRRPETLTLAELGRLSDLLVSP